MADKAPEAATKTSPSPAASPPSKKSPSPLTSPTGKKSPSPAAPEPSTGILPADHWTQDPVPADDADSFVRSIQSSTASVSSSILNYRTLQGRRYHSDIGNVEYWGSNDEQQSEALDINHHALTLACDGKLYYAPLQKDKLHKVLDIGTGTGIWAIDFADEFPEAEVIGTDISPIQPTWIPPNLKFEVEDCTREWTFAGGSADYIHMRWLMGSIPDWDVLFGEAYKTLKPGGWLESYEASPVVESDHGEVPDGSALGQWGKFFVEGGKKIERPFTVVQDGLQMKSLEAAGFVDIQKFHVKIPIGNWPKDPQQKELGTLAQLVIESDTEGHILFMANTLGWKREEIQVYIAHLRRELRSNKYLPYYRSTIVIGRKPE